jgi:CRISPR type III-B/RAMP module RAMP protein Cmr1
MSWTRLTLQVRTPLFGGDDPRQQDGCPVRVPSIRGALRFWFRAVAAGHGVSDLEALWKAEQAVFGSTSQPSAIGLRVSKQPTMGGCGSRPDWATTEGEHGFDGAQYLLGQGLWDRKSGLRRGYVERDAEFLLDIRFSRDDKQVNARFMLALWAWLTYGGLGARTRRGFGQLVCTAIRGDLPCGWTPADLLPPADVVGWRALGKCAVPDALPGLDSLGWDALLPGSPDDDEPHPEIPTLAPRWWGGRVFKERVHSFGDALHLAGLQWRLFRAPDPGKKPSQPTHSPEWTNVIHGSDDRYPIAAFGLPVAYFSRSRGADFTTTVTPELAGTQLRRASPVWLRPVLFSDGRWGIFSHVFYARLLPEGTTLKMKDDRTLKSPPAKVAEVA